MDKTQQQKSNPGRLTGVFLLGTLVGAAIGVLLAPDKGRETRKKIFSMRDGISAELRDLLNGACAGKERTEDPEANNPV